MTGALPRKDAQEVIPILLSLTKALKLNTTISFKALSLFADQFLQAFQGSEAADDAAVRGPGPALLLSAAGCVVIAAKSNPAYSKQEGLDMLLRDLSVALATIGATSRENCSSQRLLEAEKFVSTSLDLGEGNKLTTDYICEYYNSLSSTCRSIISINTCYDITEVLYDGSQFLGTLTSGGKLMAAAVIATAFALGSKDVELSPIIDLSKLSGYPKEVILAQAKSLLTFVLN